MKLLFKILLLFLAVQLSAAPAALLNLSGRVYWGMSGKPASNATIQIKEINRVVLADNNGYFNLDSIRSGNYTILAQKDDIQSYPKTYSIDKTDSISIVIDTNHTRFDDVIIEADKPNEFGISNLMPVEGTAIYADRKSEVLRMNDITANLAANNARQVFSKVSGLNIWENDGAGIQLNIGGRGLSPNRVSNFNTRQNGYDIAADALGYPESYYTPPMEALDRIEVVRGAASLQYGTQFGGFLNFKLKDGHNSKAININSRQTAGSFGMFNSFNSIGGTVGSNNYYGYVQYKRGDGWRNNSGFDVTTYYFKDKFDINQDLSITGEYTHMNYLAQQAGGLTDAMFNNNAQMTTRDRNWFSVDWNILALNIDYKITNNIKLNSRTYQLSAARNAVGFLGPANRMDPMGERGLIKGDFNNLGNETRALINYQLVKDVPSSLLVGFRLYSGETSQQQGNGTDADNADFSFNSEDDLLVNYTNPSSNIALFAENLFRLNENWTITPGVRFENIRTAANGYYVFESRDFAGNLINRERFDESRNNNRSFMLLGIGTGYHFENGTEIYANIAQNYRAITFNDMRISNPNFRIDQNLTDERGYSGDIGIRGNIDKLLYFDANAFYLYYFDRIGNVLREDEKTYVPYRYRTNIADSRSVGIELFTEINTFELFDISKEYGLLSLFVNTSITNAVYLSSMEPAFNGNQVENTPPFMIRTGLSYKSEDFTATLNYSYVDQHFTDATNSVSSSNAITGIIPSYQVIDLSVSYNFGFFKLESGINNLLDERYFTRRATGYPGPGILPADGRSFYITLGVTP